MGRNRENVIALMLLKKNKPKANPQKKTQKAVAEKVLSFKARDGKYVSISEAQIMSKTCML